MDVMKIKSDQISASVQDCSNTIANALQLLQSCMKPSMYMLLFRCYISWNIDIVLLYIVSILFYHRFIRHVFHLPIFFQVPPLLIVGLP